MVWDTLGLVSQAVIVSAIPAGSMLIGSMLVFWLTRVNSTFQACMQNFSGGIIIAAVGGELFPLIIDGPGKTIPSERELGLESVGLIIGFLCASATLFGADLMCSGGVEEIVDPKEKAIAGKDDSKDKGETVPLSAIQSSGSANEMNAESGSASSDKLVAVPTWAQYAPRARTQLLDIQVELAKMQEHLTRADIKRFNFDKHTHQLGHKLDNMRIMLTGEDMCIQPGVAKMLAAGLQQMQNTTRGMQDQAKEDMSSSLDELESQLENLHRIYEVWRAPHVLRRWSFVEEPPADAVLPNVIPWSATVAVGVDTFVDGFLIGLAYVAKPQAGFTMAGATTIEMTFLGLTFTAQLRSLSRQWHKTGAIVFTIPFLMPLGALCGAALASVVEAQPAVFLGFIAFCTVALLFLVTQELLVEARENSKRWWPHLWFFGGVLIPLLVSRHTEERDH